MKCLLTLLLSLLFFFCQAQTEKEKNAIGESLRKEADSIADALRKSMNITYNAAANFEIKISEIKFFRDSADRGKVSFICCFELTNKTAMKFYSFKFAAIVKGEPPVSIDGALDNIGIDYAEVRKNRKHTKLDKDSLWLPKTAQLFKFSSAKFDISELNSTPAHLNIEFKLDCTGFPSSYYEVKFIDLLPQWKEFQKEIGLK